MKKLLTGFALAISMLMAPLYSQAATDTSTYEGQAAALINPLLSSIPGLTGDAIGIKLTQIITGQSGVNSLQITDGLSARLGGVTLSPIGASVVFTMDHFEIVPASNGVEAVYATGVVSGGFGYNLLTNKISLTLNSGNNGPVVYEGGPLSGTTIAFNNLSIVINTSQYIPFWEDPVAIKGGVSVNGVNVPVEQIIDLIGLLSKFAG
ncbi:MAG: hypothetical protein H7A08_00955 [Oceanospirillaceae bacterium]|nr:hypothetical protein [Oceanospirillaceae bacterium]